MPGCQPAEKSGESEDGNLVAFIAFIILGGGGGNEQPCYEVERLSWRCNQIIMPPYFNITRSLTF